MLKEWTKYSWVKKWGGGGGEGVDDERLGMKLYKAILESWIYRR